MNESTGLTAQPAKISSTLARVSGGAVGATLATLIALVAFIAIVFSSLHVARSLGVEGPIGLLVSVRNVSFPDKP